jgi:hypothetical protein
MSYRLLENGKYRLLESGYLRFLESRKTPPPFLLGFGARKKIGNPATPDPLGVKGIYQMRMTKRGKVPIKMKFYRSYVPPTAGEIANRQKFADAMSAWGALTSEQKAVYNTRAKKRMMFGWGLFIREYYQFN